MVYLVEYRNLNKAPAQTKIMCLEPRDDEKFESFSPLVVSPFVKSLIRQKREKQAVTELSRMAKSDQSKPLLAEMKKAGEDFILVSWEPITSSITEVRKKLLDKWKIAYDVIA